MLGAFVLRLNRLLSLGLCQYGHIASHGTWRQPINGADSAALCRKIRRIMPRNLLLFVTALIALWRSVCCSMLCNLLLCATQFAASCHSIRRFMPRRSLPFYANSRFTASEMALPSALPASCLLATPITLPISLTLCAPVCAMMSFTAASISASVIGCGR